MSAKTARTTSSAAKRRSQAESPQDSVYARIYAQVCAIPRGRVSTYGGIAQLVGCGPRQVGYAMASLPHGSGVPWQRVINHKGEISCRSHRRSTDGQRARLSAEGVIPDRKGRIDLKRFGWPDPKPGPAKLDGPATRAGSRRNNAQ
ncbi:MAG: MGMT family protein [Gammaproteobacteria bacterium]|nr:MGMT family protein [Gammaproteobacteria bacterium]MDE2024277.1 MGMT family protein [Gammaproteobacteria bacterium]